VNHYAAPDFWASYELLPSAAKEVANKAFELLKADPRHPSLHFNKGGGVVIGTGRASVSRRWPDCFRSLLSKTDF